MSASAVAEVVVVVVIVVVVYVVVLVEGTSPCPDSFIGNTTIAGLSSLTSFSGEGATLEAVVHHTARKHHTARQQATSNNMQTTRAMFGRSSEEAALLTRVVFGGSLEALFDALLTRVTFGGSSEASFDALLTRVAFDALLTRVAFDGSSEVLFGALEDALFTCIEKSVKWVDWQVNVPDPPEMFVA